MPLRIMSKLNEIAEEKEVVANLGECGEDAILLEDNEMRFMDVGLVGLEAAKNQKAAGGNYEEIA